MGGEGGGVLSGQDLLASPFSLFLVQVIIVILITRALASFLQYLKQPRVIAEVITGILLGPSVFGTQIPGFSHVVFPPKSLPSLTLVANIGLVLYLFCVGIELDPSTMAANAKKTFLIAILGIAFPFGLGWLMAPVLYHNTSVASDTNVNMTSFSVFIACAISITAFPVLARIINETNLLCTPVGITALGAAAIDDVTAWSLLALSVALIHASEPMIAAWILLSVMAYAIGVLFFLRPIWTNIVEMVDATGSHGLRATLLAFTFLLVFFSAWVTEILGVHAIFGAFLIGLIMPRGHRFTLMVTERVEDIVSVVFLPLYFAASGLHVNINGLNTKDVAMFFMVLSVAIVAKLLGCGLGARMMGLDFREALTVGILMNTRGLVELIVLNVGREAGVIDERLFTVMVMVALVTTMMTTPCVHLVYPPSKRKIQDMDMIVGAVGSRHSTPSSKRGDVPQGADDFSLLVVVDRMEEVPMLSTIMTLFQYSMSKKHNMTVQAINLVESSESSSADILRAARPYDGVYSAPSLYMVKSFGDLLDMDVTTESIVGSSNNFADSLAMRSRTTNLVILPFRDTQITLGISDYHHKLVADTINKIQCPLAVLLNPESQCRGVSQSRRRDILVIITWNTNDLEVLGIAARLKKVPGLHIQAVVVEGEQQAPGGGEEQGPTMHALKAALDKLECDRMDMPRDKVNLENLTLTARNYDLIIVGGTTNHSLSSNPSSHNLAAQAHHHPTDSASSIHSMRQGSRHHHHSRTRSAFEVVSPRSRRETLLGPFSASLMDVKSPTLVVFTRGSSGSTIARKTPTTLPVMSLRIPSPLMKSPRPSSSKDRVMYSPVRGNSQNEEGTEGRLVDDDDSGGVARDNTTTNTETRI